MSVGSILNTARSGMNAQQLAITVASQNIANAQTDGYSRQRVELATSMSTVFPYGVLGTGVDVKTITRARDSMLDASYRASSASQSNAETTSTALGQIQSVFDEPSDSGLSATLDAFWSSWNDLAGDPTNGAAKSAVRAAGDNVASTLNRFAGQIDDQDRTNRLSANADVTQANSLLSQVGDYNRQIVSAEAGGNTANDLRDARDRLVDQLSTLTGGTTIERSNGSIAFFANGRMLLDGTMVKSLQMNNGQPPSVSIVGESGPVTGMGGTIGAKLDVSANRIPGVMAQLDALAKTIVTTVNAAHNGATTYTGNPPVAGTAGNFFAQTNPPSASDPYLTARGITLDPTLASGDNVAAASATATGPGNADVANAMAGLRDRVLSISSASGAPLGSNSIGGFFAQTVGDLASSTKFAQDDATVQGTLASNAQTRRQSVSSVSTDEELISVIQHQHSYQAAARLVTVVDEMTQTLVDLGR